MRRRAAEKSSGGRRASAARRRRRRARPAPGSGLRAPRRAAIRSSTGHRTFVFHDNVIGILTYIAALSCSCVWSLRRLPRYGTYTDDDAAAIPPLHRLIISCETWLTRNPASDNKLNKIVFCGGSGARRESLLLNL